MKKVFALIAVLALTAPVMAADPNVVITCEDLGSGVVQVSYEVLIEDGVDPGLVRGFAFNIEADNGCLIDVISGYAADGAAVPADSENVAAGYSIYMGSVGFGTDPNTIDDYGNPVAPATDVDALGGLGTSGITVEMGSLYDPDTGTPPADSGVLFTITLSDPTSAGSCSLTITAEPTRGGIVMESGASASLLSDGCDVTFAPPPCMATTNPDFGLWDSLGRPACWCYERNCRGDVDDAMEFGLFWVLDNDLALFRTSYAQMTLPAGGICADFARDIEFGLFRVLDNDLAIFRTYYANMTVPTCSGPGSGNDENPLPNSEYNFWTHP